MKIDDIVVKDLQGLNEKQLLEFAFIEFGARAAIGTSLQKTGVVAIDIASRLRIDPNVFFIDTLLNPKETYELLFEVEGRYSLNIGVYTPTEEDFQELYKQFGEEPHYSNPGQEACCNVRKVRPRDKALSELDVWLSGIRADQSEHRRENGEKVSIVEVNGRRILKINPLFDWTQGDVDAYIHDNNVPYNKLYDLVTKEGKRYKVIGCEPCHVPVGEDEPARNGKFPWKTGYKKECGVHCELFSNGSGI